MSRKKIKRYIKYFCFIIFAYFFVFLLVQFEKSHADSNIKTFGDGLWYTIITLTTVGYGDFYPVTFGGKLLSLIAVFGSLGILSLLISKVSIQITTYMEDKKQGAFGTKFKDHYIIIGWNEFSKSVANQITEAGHKIAVITNKKDDIDIIKEGFGKNAFVLFTDYDNYNSYDKVGILRCSKVFINFEDDSKTLIHIINLKKVYPQIEIVVSLNSHDLKDTFKSVGVMYLVSKNEIASKLVASYIYEPQAATLTEDLTEVSHNEWDYDIIQFKITEKNPYLNQDYLDVFPAIKQKYNSILMGISKTAEGNKLIKNPNTSVKIELNDYLIIMASGTMKILISEDFDIKDGRI